MDLRAAAQGKLSQQAIEDLIDLACKKSRKRGQVNILFAFVLIATTTVGVVVSRRFSDSDMVGFGALAGIFIIAVIDNVLHHKRTENIFTQLLFESGIRPNHCLKCKYDLRGSAGNNCPECGESLASLQTSTE
ncbi:MAG: hypothetical protein AB8C95_13110 [Phycisphaeraceae bacterium]